MCHAFVCVYCVCLRVRIPFVFVLLFFLVFAFVGVYCVCLRVRLPLTLRMCVYFITSLLRAPCAMLLQLSFRIFFLVTFLFLLVSDTYQKITLEFSYPGLYLRVVWRQSRSR
jgi:hypothetical protein